MLGPPRRFFESHCTLDMCQLRGLLTLLPAPAQVSLTFFPGIASLSTDQGAFAAWPSLNGLGKANGTSPSRCPTISDRFEVMSTSAHRRPHGNREIASRFVRRVQQCAAVCSSVQCVVPSQFSLSATRYTLPRLRLSFSIVLDILPPCVSPRGHRSSIFLNAFGTICAKRSLSPYALSFA